MERVSVSSLVLKLALLLPVLLLLVIPKGVGGFSERIVVRVRNDLGREVETLFIHCKSRKDDLGERRLADGMFMEWSFKISLWHTTRYICGVNWKDRQEEFSAYWSRRDSGRCKLQCWWSIRPDGAYSFNEKTQVYERLYAWNNLGS